MNLAVYQCFTELMRNLETNYKRLLLEPGFTHIGISVSRSFNQFKLIAIIFKKSIAIHHVSYKMTEGIIIHGRMNDPYASIYGIAVKEKNCDKVSIIGPRKIMFDFNSREFSIKAPRHMINRSNGVKILEFYVMNKEPQNMGYGQGPDISNLTAPGMSLAHKMEFEGIWESNTLVEERSNSDNQFLIDENKSKQQAQLMVFSTDEFKTSRGRGRGSIRGGTTTRPTPYKDITSSRASGLETIKEAVNSTTNRSTWNKPNTNRWSSREWANTTSNTSLQAVENNPRSDRHFVFPDLATPTVNVQNTPINTGYNSSFNQPTHQLQSSTLNTLQNENRPMPIPFCTQPALPVPQPFVAPQIISTPSNMNPFSNQGNPNPYGQSAVMMSQQPAFTANIFNGGSFQGQSQSHHPPMQSMNTPQNMPQQFQGTIIQPNPFGGSAMSLNHLQPTQFMNTGVPSDHLSSNYSMPSMKDSTHSQVFIPANTSGSSISPFTVSTSQPLSSNIFNIQSTTHLPQSQPVSIPKPPSVLSSTGSFKVSGNLDKYLLEDGAVESKEDSELVTLPCLVLPIPKLLLSDVRRVRGENEMYISLFNTMEYYDVLLKIGDTELKAHRAVLYSSCQFFKEQLDKLKAIPANIHMAKIILPTWIKETPFKVVLKFMYSCDIEKEKIDLNLARDILYIVDHINLHELLKVIIVKYILTQLSKEEVLNILKLTFGKGKEDTRQAWDYLRDSCIELAAQHSNWLVRNRRTDVLSLPIGYVFALIDKSVNYITSRDHITLLIKLLIDARYADCIFQLTAKITNLYLMSYSDQTLDIRMVDYVRPFQVDQISKLDPKQVMEYGLLTEDAPYFKTVSRQNPKPLVLATIDNRCCQDRSDKDSGYGYSSLSSSLELVIDVPKSKARDSPPVFIFEFEDASRPRNLVSKVFKTASRCWSVLVNISEDSQISLFLLERGEVDTTNSEILYTSVIFDLEIEDENLKETVRTGSQGASSVCFYSFPNNHFHCVGERNYCKVSQLRNSKSCKVKVYIKELGVHSSVMHYLCDNFESLLGRGTKNFKGMSHFNLKYLLTSDKLNVKDEHAATSAIWSYGASHDQDILNLLVTEIRLEYLPLKDLFTIGRDHKTMRACPNFKYLFQKEYYRRLQNLPHMCKPRESYAEHTEPTSQVNFHEEFLSWLLTTNHHEGYEEKLNEMKKKFEEEKIDLNKKKAELVAVKNEMYIENEKLMHEVVRKKQPEQRRVAFSNTEFQRGDLADLKRRPLVEMQPNTPKQECIIW